MGTKKKGTSFKQQTETAIKKIEQLQKDGFVFQGMTGMPTVSSIPQSKTRHKDMATVTIGGSMVGVGAKMFCSELNAADSIEGGTPNKGFIRWGPKNDLPAQIYRAAGELPYTAEAIKYLVDLTVGLGPQLMYCYPVYAADRVKEEMCPFEFAGYLIRNRILAIRQQLAAQQQQEPDPTPSEPEPDEPLVVGSAKGKGKQEYRTKAEPVTNTFVPTPPETLGTLTNELDRLIKDHEMWERTMVEVEEFHKNNNLNDQYVKYCTDDVHLDISFPTIGLSKGNSNEWKPKIKKVGIIPAICCRFEEKDEHLVSNYVYYAEKWRAQNAKIEKTGDSVAYPALPEQGRLQALNAKIEKESKKGVKDRELWYACPIIYPSGMRAYYPIPAWWSIFTSFVYQYAMTLVSDKYIAQRNSTMWGKLIYINAYYLEKLYDQLGDTTDDAKKKRRDALVDSINNFLKSRENNGKTCALDEFLGPDGKTTFKSIELVDVPTPQKATMTKEEMEQISSIIFFALGVHPGLVGAVPGKTTSGGTFQRELSLLKQQQVSGRQRAYLQLLNDIVAFNGWDKHARYVIKQQVLTTLDRNANGLEETVSE